MKINELIKKLSEFDGDMEVVFRTYERFDIDEHEVDYVERDHNVEISTSDTICFGAWETRKVKPYVVIGIED